MARTVAAKTANRQDKSDDKMLVKSIMRTPVTTVTPRTTVSAAAALMKELGIGVWPVCENGRILGILTDRDIVTRCCLNARLDGTVADIMTARVATCRPDQTVQSAANRMGDLQIRRLVVVDAAGAPVGILTLGDIANDADEELAGQSLGEIVETR